MRVRQPAVAGRFYPGHPAALAAIVDELIAEVRVPEQDRLAAGYVVPHAGYRFSGPVAAQVYARLRRHADRVRRVVLVGPSHFAPLTGAAVPITDRWLTPLGEFPVDTEVREKLLAGGYAVADDHPHQREHALEVQLPFLARTVGRVPVLPIAVGATPKPVDNPVDSTVDAVETVAAAITEGGPGTVLLCSTDFSHYHDHATAQRLDRITAEAVIRLQPEGIGTLDACGRHALRGTVGWARQRGLTPRLLDLRTSADTFGRPERVVGYPAFAFH